MRIYLDGTQVRIDSDTGEFIKSVPKGVLTLNILRNGNLRLYNRVTNFVEFEGASGNILKEDGTPDGSTGDTITRLNSFI